MDRTCASNVVTLLGSWGVSASVVGQGQHTAAVRLPLPDGREGLWEGGQSTDLSAQVLRDGVLVGYVAQLPGSADLPLAHTAWLIATAKLDLRPPQRPDPGPGERASDGQSDSAARHAARDGTPQPTGSTDSPLTAHDGRARAERPPNAPPTRPPGRHPTRQPQVHAPDLVRANPGPRAAPRQPRPVRLRLTARQAPRGRFRQPASRTRHPPPRLIAGAAPGRGARDGHSTRSTPCAGPDGSAPDRVNLRCGRPAGLPGRRPSGRRGCGPIDLAAGQAHHDLKGANRRQDAGRLSWPGRHCAFNVSSHERRAAGPVPESRLSGGGHKRPSLRA